MVTKPLRKRSRLHDSWNDHFRSSHRNRWDVWRQEDLHRSGRGVDQALSFVHKAMELCKCSDKMSLAMEVSGETFFQQRGDEDENNAYYDLGLNAREMAKRRRVAKTTRRRRKRSSMMTIVLRSRVQKNFLRR